MVLIDSGRYSMVRLFVVVALLALPVSVFAECRVVEFPDHNEVVCEEYAVSQGALPQRRELSKLEASGQKEFLFYAPVNPITKIFIAADVSPYAIASPGDILFYYRAEELKDKSSTMSAASFVFEERSGDSMFTLREEGNGEPKVTNLKFNDKKNHLLLFPYKSGCSSSAADGVYLKMNRMDGNQLYYQIILPPCLSKQMEMSIKE